MAGKIITPVDPQSELAELPLWMKKFHAEQRPMKLEELLPGDTNKNARNALSSGKSLEYKTKNGIRKTTAVMRDGYVVATAASISRTQGKSFDFVKDIADFIADTGKREDKIPVFYRVYKGDGFVNNSINKMAGLVSHEGRIFVKHAKLGKRKVEKVRDELTRVLDFWMSNVNARPLDGPITGARGATQIEEQGTRQALIEGSYIGYAYNRPTKIPSLDGKAWDLPMFIQSMSTQFIVTTEYASGTGLEQFYWKPPRQLINQLRNPRGGPEQKKQIQEAFPSEILNQLLDSGQVALEGPRLVHVKHRGVDFEPFGDSFVEPLMSDIAYKRALQQLDFVTIDSLVNRIVIIKIGSDKPDSVYHNLESAQLRAQALENHLGDPGPNMQIIWAGPDINVIEVGAHDTILDIDGRHNIAVERLLLSGGIPRALLDGKESSGQVWAGYEGLRETLRAMQNAWAAGWTGLAERIAAENGYEDVELVYAPVRSVLADQTAGADLALRSRKAGLMSIRRSVAELGGNFDAERRNMLIEKGFDPDLPPDQLPTDEKIFTPPIGMPGDTRTNEDGDVKDPGGEPGRPNDSEREDLAQERDKEKKQRTKPTG